MEHPHEDVPPGTLVRFRAMIQDMLNPQYYSASIRIYNSGTKETTVSKGKYRSNVLNPVRIIIFKENFVSFIYLFINKICFTV